MGESEMLTQIVLEKYLVNILNIRTQRLLRETQVLVLLQYSYS